ncbi:MAG: VOC family protein [Candidatus Peribacteraceae bacterium]|nr:VOC family protein [Candidatus Peribacteraceae bacterium]
MQKISPCLWFDTQAEEAVKLYTSIFKNSKVGETSRYDAEAAKVSGQPEGSVLTVEFEIEGHAFTALNGGPIFKLTPAISFFVNCEKIEEVDALWEKLSDGGKTLMELGKYPYSEKYGWVQDKFGVTWQLMHVTEKPKQKIVPCFLFVGKNFGKADEALKFYVSTFPDANVDSLQKAPPGPPYNNPDAVMHAAITLRGQSFSIMDGPGEHAFTFTEAISLIVNCETQEEIDGYWKKLSAVKESEQCGWLKDKYGVSWQIVPTILGKLLADKDKEKAGRVMKAMLEMKKLDIKKLQEAYEGK